MLAPFDWETTSLAAPTGPASAGDLAKCPRCCRRCPEPIWPVGPGAAL